MFGYSIHLQLPFDLSEAFFTQLKGRKFYIQHYFRQFVTENFGGVTTEPFENDRNKSVEIHICVNEAQFSDNYSLSSQIILPEEWGFDSNHTNHIVEDLFPAYLSKHIIEDLLAITPDINPFEMIEVFETIEQKYGRALQNLAK